MRKLLFLVLTLLMSLQLSVASAESLFGKDTSIAGVKLGDSYESVVERFGRDRSPYPNPPNSKIVSWVGDDFSVTFTIKGNKTSACQIVSRSLEYATNTGVYVGMHISKVVERFGQPDEVVDLSNKEDRTIGWCYNKGKTKMTFDMIDNIITEITLEKY